MCNVSHFFCVLFPRRLRSEMSNSWFTFVGAIVRSLLRLLARCSSLKSLYYRSSTLNSGPLSRRANPPIMTLFSHSLCSAELVSPTNAMTLHARSKCGIRTYYVLPSCFPRGFVRLQAHIRSLCAIFLILRHREVPCTYLK